MGQRGPPPKPTKLRLLEGNRGRLKINPHEPQPDPTLPDCPPWIDAEARAEWGRVTPQLHAMGVLTKIDRADLIGYCMTFSVLKAMYLTFRELGPTQDTAAGAAQSRPEIREIEKLLTLLRVYAADFGMTPAARSKVTATKEPQDKFDAIFG